MNSKERAALRSRAMDIKPVFSVGKSGITPELTEAVRASIKKRELLKINVLKNCETEPEEIGRVLAERTRSQLVEVIGRKIVLYKENPELRKKEKEKEKKSQSEKSRSGSHDKRSFGKKTFDKRSFKKHGFDKKSSFGPGFKKKDRRKSGGLRGKAGRAR